MILTGKCPKCDAVIQHVNLESPSILAGLGGPSWVGVSYLCPNCRTILGVGIDPVAIKADIVAELKTHGR